MIPIQPEMTTLFDRQLFGRQISSGAQLQDRKWLRYYLDFWHKYHFNNKNGNSLPHFLNRLHGKNQTEQQRSCGL